MEADGPARSTVPWIGVSGMDTIDKDAKVGREVSKTEEKEGWAHQLTHDKPMITRASGK